MFPVRKATGLDRQLAAMRLAEAVTRRIVEKHILGCRKVNDKSLEKEIELEVEIYQLISASLASAFCYWLLSMGFDDHLTRKTHGVSTVYHPSRSDITFLDLSNPHIFDP